jgi:hypothetical protein
MKNMALLLSVTLVLLVAACVQLPFGREQVGTGPGSIELKNSDVTIQALAYPAEVRGGSDISVKWDITNMQEDEPLSDVNVNAYDTCLFSGTETTKHFDTIQPNRTQTWDWRWSSQTTPFERDCEIKFTADWSGTAHVSQQISVLADSEYYTREQAGTLSELSGTYTATSNPIYIGLRFSDPLPWQNDSTVYMHIDVSNNGEGLIDKMPKGSIQITVPNNLAGSCDGYITSGSSLVLDRDLNFVSGRAPSLTCTFTTTADEPISTGVLNMSANYKYELDNSFTVKVKTK